MRDFCKISPQFWTGQTGKDLRKDRDAQLVALYLMTSPHSNMIGIYVLPVMYIAHETGLPLEGASKALASLCAIGFCTFEADSELIWVHEMAKYQIGEQLDPKDKRCKGVQNELAKVPSSLLRKAFFSRYKNDFHLTPEPKKTKGLPSPIEAPCKQGEGEGEGEGEENARQAASPDGFAVFYARYPKKVGRPAAEKAFKSAKVNGHLADLLSDIDARLSSGEWSDEKKQFIPNPATYLNQRRWEDERSEPTNLFAGAI